MMEPSHGAETGTPLSVVTRPQRRFGPEADPVAVPDPDVLPLDPAFEAMLDESGTIQRAWTGGEWLEGPAWSSAGRYLVFSDNRQFRQHRLIWETGEVTVFRPLSHGSNGNGFDFEGRLLVCEEHTRRVVRFEHDGGVRVLADGFEGGPLNSPNDIVAHPDGSVWFTDPPFGRRLVEGRPDRPDGPANPGGRINPGIGNETAAPADASTRQPAGVYRWDPGGRLDQVLDEAALPSPNGLAFSPGYETLYVASTGPTPGDPPAPSGDKAIHAFAMQGTRPTSGRVLFDMVVDGVHCGPDGFKVDVFGNLWCAAAGPLGYAGVIAVNAAGKPIGRIRLPEVCPNLSFGGPRRNVLFMPATRSLYRLRLNVQGAGPS